jgi:protoheme IX farnesyltransferase
MNTITTSSARIGGEQSPLSFGGPAFVMPATADWRDWLQLLKPRVVSLVVFTGWIGLFLAPGHLHPVIAFTAILCIAVAAGAAGAINMWYERDIDALMHRTRKRPIPAGRIEPDAALGFGVALAVGSVLVMWLATNLAAATVLAISIAFYVFVYTIWLKRRTPQNIVIGGAAGAFPAVIGWAAVTGTVDVLPLLLFGIVFFWTPPHFWALSLYACQDYGRAGVPMLPVVAGARHTRHQIFGYTLVLGVIAVLPWALGYAGPVYGIPAALLSLGFVAFSWLTLRDRQDAAGNSLTNDRPARLTFRYSLAYLALIFVAIAADKVVHIL